MKYCSNCLMTELKPGIRLDERGLCNACRSKEIKKNINWDQKLDELKAITKKIKDENHSFYDCIVPVSGGKDGWVQAKMISKELGLKVLCVTLSAHLQTTEGIHNLNSMIEDLNVDHIKITLKPSFYRTVRKKCFLKKGEAAWAEHCAVFASVVNIAVIYDVPLIVWGEDIAFEFGGGQRESSTASAIEIDKSDLNKDGHKIDDWLDDDLSERDTFFYKYPDYQILEDADIKSIYLGHYINWYGRRNYETVKERGFMSLKDGPLPGNYLDYDNIDEKLCDVNIWFKYLKFGFWRPTDQVCYDLWNDRISREEAVKIVNDLNDQFPETYFNEFLKYHMITEEEFWQTADKFRNSDIWEKINNQWIFKYPPTNS